MTEENFDTNLVKMIAASAYALVALRVSREMFGRGYFALGMSERTLVDQATLGMVGSNYQSITPELLKTQKPAEVPGFQVPAPKTGG